MLKWVGLGHVSHRLEYGGRRHLYEIRRSLEHIYFKEESKLQQMVTCWGGQESFSSARASFLSCVDGQTAFQTNVILRDEGASFLEKQAQKGGFSNDLRKRAVCSRSVSLVTKGQINVKSVFPGDKEQIIQNGESMQSYYLTWQNCISKTGFCLPQISQGSFIYQMGHNVC